jgi:hypothetical protein
VGINRGRFCKLEASGTVASTLFGTHHAIFPAYPRHTHQRLVTHWLPFRSVITSDQLNANGGNGGFEANVGTIKSSI